MPFDDSAAGLRPASPGLGEAGRPPARLIVGADGQEMPASNGVSFAPTAGPVSAQLLVKGIP